MGSDNPTSERRDAGIRPAALQTARDRAISRLVVALRTRPGHVLVVGETAAEAEELFRTAEGHVESHRRVAVDGRALDPDAVRRTLAPDAFADTLPVVEEARRAGLPIIVVITHADAAAIPQLERLRHGLEGVPDAIGTVRLALLGTPRLLAAMSRPEARALSTRIVAVVRVPAKERPPLEPTPTVLAPIVPEPTSAGRLRLAIGVGAVGAVLGAVLLAIGVPRRGRAPVPEPSGPPGVAATVREPVETPAASPPVAPAPAALQQEPAVTSAPTAVPQAAAVAPAPAGAPQETPSAAVAPPPDAASPARVPARHTALALQVGAFRRADNAEALRARLAARFANVGVVPFQRDGFTYHRVLVRDFASEADREAAAQALRADGYPSIRARD